MMAFVVGLGGGEVTSPHGKKRLASGSVVRWGMAFFLDFFCLLRVLSCAMRCCGFVL